MIGKEKKTKDNEINPNDFIVVANDGFELLWNFSSERLYFI